MRGYKKDKVTGKKIAEARASMETMYLEDDPTPTGKAVKSAKKFFGQKSNSVMHSGQGVIE